MVDVLLVRDSAHFCPVGLVQDVSNGPSQRELEVPTRGTIVSKVEFISRYIQLDSLATYLT